MKKIYDRDKLLGILFNKDEKVCIGGAKESVNVKSPFDEEGEYYTINPLCSVDYDHNRKDHYSYLKPRRADINVSRFRNFIFEIDSIPVLDQLELLKQTEIPFAGLVYSGGKSIHALLSLEESLGGEHTLEGVKQYKRVWERLAGFIDKKSMEMGWGKVVDQSCKNPSRFTRYPEYRVEGRGVQRVFKCDGKRLSVGEFNSLLLKCPELEVREISNARKVRGDVKDKLDFWKKSSVGLRNSIKYPLWARSSAGLYPEALKIVLWAIDETGVSKELLIQVFENTVFRQYKKVDYPEEKWYTAIDDGFRIKG